MIVRARILLPLLALVVGVFTWWLWPESVELQLRRELLELARLNSFEPNENAIAKQRAIGKTKTLLSPEISLQINLQNQPTTRITGRHELMEHVQQVRFGVPKLHIEFLDIKIEVLGDGHHALATTTLSAQIDQQQEYQELKVAFENKSDGWQISRVETVKTWGR